MLQLTEQNINDLKKYISKIFCKIESFKYLEIEVISELMCIKLFIDQDYLVVDRLTDNTIKQNIMKRPSIVVDAVSNGIHDTSTAGTIDFEYSVYDVVTKEKIEDFFQKYS